MVCNGSFSSQKRQMDGGTPIIDLFPLLEAILNASTFQGTVSEEAIFLCSHF
jgi:hypothetical protein